MATATKQSETIETIKGVTLELTLEEARTLAVVYGKVGGGFDGPRKHTDSVLRALEDVGVTYGGTPEYELADSARGFYFNDYPAVEG